jgi:hypothetical protein
MMITLAVYSYCSWIIISHVYGGNIKDEGNVSLISRSLIKPVTYQNAIWRIAVGKNLARTIKNTNPDINLDQKKLSYRKHLERDNIISTKINPLEHSGLLNSNIWKPIYSSILSENLFADSQMYCDISHAKELRYKYNYADELKYILIHQGKDLTYALVDNDGKQYKDEKPHRSAKKTLKFFVRKMIKILHQH